MNKATVKPIPETSETPAIISQLTLSGRRPRPLRTASHVAAVMPRVFPATDDHVDCPEKAATGDPLDLLDQTGGFSIPLDEALQHFDGGETSAPSSPSAG